MLVSLTVLVGLVPNASAQLVAAAHNSPPYTATTAEVIAGNALMGGVVAGVQAVIRGKDPFRAFGIGAVGGLVHLAGKNFAVEGGAARAWTGLAVSSAGTSMIANGGRGIHPFAEMVLPIGPLRLRYARRDSAGLRASMNLFESASLLRTAMRDGLRLDWSRSVETGSIAFVTERMLLFDGPDELNGTAMSPYYVLSAFAPDMDMTARHEVVHVHQQLLLQETIGWPLEQFLRSRVTLGRRVPRWLELGFGGPALAVLEDWAVGGRGISPLAEAEAYLLMRR